MRLTSVQRRIISEGFESLLKILLIEDDRTKAEKIYALYQNPGSAGEKNAARNAYKKLTGKDPETDPPRPRTQKHAKSGDADWWHMWNQHKPRSKPKPKKTTPVASGKVFTLPKNIRLTKKMSDAGQMQIPLDAHEVNKFAEMAGVGRVNRRNPIWVTIKTQDYGKVTLVVMDPWGLWVAHQKMSPTTQAAEKFIFDIINNYSDPHKYKVVDVQKGVVI